MDPCSRQEERLIVHVELDYRRVWHVHDRLAGPRQRGRALRMHDRPGLVETVDERSGGQRRAAFLEAAADAGEAVAEREDGLRAIGELIGVPRLGDAPFIGREEMLRRQNDLTLEHDLTVIPRSRNGQKALITTDHRQPTAPP
jgi:hypothetical protein